MNKLKKSFLCLVVIFCCLIVIHLVVFVNKSCKLVKIFFNQIHLEVAVYYDIDLL